MKANENIWLFLMPIVIKKSYRLANGNTKYDNHGGGQAMLLTQGSWDEVRDRLIMQY